MSVDTEDMHQDFGEHAVLAFQSGKYSTLCDLMLQQLDRMMGADSKLAPPTPPLSDETSSLAVDNNPEAKDVQDKSLQLEDETNALDLLLQDSENNQDIDECPDLSSKFAELDAMEASALKIQCAARQQQARGKVNRIRTQKHMEHMEASALRIQ
ncbi:Hypothetical protein PHPALM_13675, partial [Phytophthora palmivora]